MTDAKDFHPHNPVYQRSAPEPVYKSKIIQGEIEEDLGYMTWFWFEFSYYQFGNELQIVDQKFTYKMNRGRDKESCSPDIGQLDLQNIIEDAIREELGISLRESVIFESKIKIL